MSVVLAAAAGQHMTWPDVVALALGLGFVAFFLWLIRRSM